MSRGLGYIQTEILELLKSEQTITLYDIKRKLFPDIYNNSFDRYEGRKYKREYTYENMTDEQYKALKRQQTNARVKLHNAIKSLERRNLIQVTGRCDTLTYTGKTITIQRTG